MQSQANAKGGPTWRERQMQSQAKSVTRFKISTHIAQVHYLFLSKTLFVLLLFFLLIKISIGLKKIDSSDQNRHKINLYAIKKITLTKSLLCKIQLVLPYQNFKKNFKKFRKISTFKKKKFYVIR